MFGRKKKCTDSCNKKAKNVEASTECTKSCSGKTNAKVKNSK